ncbi:hypothetical protein [Saccharothrix variisporea]|uniref:CDP-glycerol:poly(Glycerophosphate) glycerophosphotransferase n=1 Tax=Saccharothrix variisporea TaxID=543527 RepID=A0A495XPC1_9PSEU|nr:hypothetical protein [Saccharothrix variisporea]RKT74744.1 hypothetical protein DFJ66_8113 [Saccharothrix variisporea]
MSKHVYRGGSPSAGRGPARESRVIASGDPVAEYWMSRRGSRRVLVVAPHLQAVTRLMDVVPVLESDFRVQVMLTVPETGYRWAGVEEHVRGLGCLTIPWHQAVDTRFDLALAACDWGVADLDAPVLLMSHGAGSVRSRISPHRDPAGHGLHAGRLVRGGEVVPAALALATDHEVAVLAGSCAAALPRAVVAGDPSYDRLLAGRPYRDVYRRALGAKPGQRVVVVTSTWSEHSLYGNDPLVLDRLVGELPAEEHLVVAVLHPFIWHGYGRRQVLAWLAAARARGLVVLPPEEGWRAALVAADLAVGDHGSVLQYAAASGVPSLMNVGSLVDVRRGSTAEVLSRVAAPLHLDRPLLPQVRRAIERGAGTGHAELAARITSRPGQALGILRRTSYRLLGLEEPAHAVPVAAVPAPRPLR